MTVEAEARVAPLAERTVVHMLQRGAALRPDQLAVVDAVTSVTYAQLLELTASVGGALRELGVQRAEPVLLMMDNSLDHVLAWFGAAWIGAVEVPLNTASMPPQIAYIADDCQAQVLVIEAGYLERVVAVADQMPQLRHVIVRGEPTVALPASWTVHRMPELRTHAAVAPVELGPQDVCGIMYTSGTTGSPKGVLVTHAQTYGRNGPLGVGSPAAGDITLVVLPIYHVLGQCRGLYNGLIALGTVVLREGFSASAFWDLCRQYGVTYTCIVGVMAEYLLAQEPRPDDADNPVRRIALGTTIKDVAAFRARFGIDECYVSYGMTEAGGVLVGPAEKDGCGYLREDFEACLVDANDMPVPDGEVGELLIRPKEPWTVMIGYYRNPEATAEKWRNLWLHTGDLMHRTPEGRYIFHGRMSERIRSKGENIAPASIEDQLAGHPALRDCAVVGVAPQDDHAAQGDQDVMLAIVPSDPQRFDPVEILMFLAERVPYFAVPRYVRTMGELPRTESTRRVQRSQIAALGAEGAWDRVEHGVVVERGGRVRVNERA